MTSVANFLYEIATEIGRPKESMNPIIKIFQDNWYDTVESLSTIDSATYEKLQIPARIVDLIKKKLVKIPSAPSPTTIENVSYQQNSQPQRQYSSGVQIGGQKMDIEERKQSERLIPLEQIAREKERKNKANWKKTLTILKGEVGPGTQFMETLNLLEKITSNILKDPSKEQFRTLKIESNPKLKAAIGVFPSAVDIIIMLGFEPVGDGVVTLKESNVNNEIISTFNAHIHQFLEENQSSFDPYKSTVSGTRSDIPNTGERKETYADKLEELRARREKMIKPTIEKREPALILLRPNQSMNDYVKSKDQEAESHPSEEIVAFKEEAKRIAKLMEEATQFTSKRKKEFEDMLKRPVYTETKIRVKFPNNTVLEATFSPKETLKTVVDFVKVFLADENWDYYLFVSPPVQKITSKNWHMSLSEFESVPSGVFYFALTDRGLEDKITKFVNS